ncbi:hypothetical protein [Streptomyces sp. NPDC090026]|uniref:hypothetical protein n=1 Tax=Streptomyces sp. NPDC090026 TaxID=3365923 RepID=UPI00381255C4
MTRTTSLNTGLDDFLAWAAAREGAPALPERPADAVLCLLALRGADRRAGVPEPTPELVARVLGEDLPGLLWATAPETDAVPQVLYALADRVHQAGRLNAKRHLRLLEAVDAAVPAFRQAMADPARLTWHRWYASLLRADGVDPDDPSAVTTWLGGYAAAPHEGRPALPGTQRRAAVSGRTFAARARLAELLLAAFSRDTRPDPQGPLLPPPPLADARPDEALGAALEALADTLTDRWTAAGLSAAFAGRHADLAPGPEVLPHLQLADRLRDDHLDYYGAGDAPLPPPVRAAAPEEVRALLHAAPLPDAVAAGVPGTTAGALPGAAPRRTPAAFAEAEIEAIAERCGFPGALAVWQGGTPQELTELAADLLAAVAERLPAVAADGPVPDGAVGADTGEDWSLDPAHLLYSLYERGGTPDSVARRVAEAAGAQVAVEAEEQPVPVPASASDDGAYALPPLAELADLLGRPEVTEAQRARLAAPARALATVVDALGATGCLFRRGDAYGLTPLGGTVLRHVLLSGGVAAPDAAEAAAWDARTTTAAVRRWPPAVAAAALAAWAEHRGGGDAEWAPLLAALAGERDAGHRGPALLGAVAALDHAGVPNGVLRSALTDPVLGAHALRVLRARGEDADAAAVPLESRALLLAEELEERRLADRHTAAAEPGGVEGGGPAPRRLLGAFDAAAADWPRGGAALVAGLARAAPGSVGGVLSALRGHHPDTAVADAAAHELKELGRRRGHRH